MAPTVTMPPAAAETPPLRLYTRQGCCLCEGLRERLEALEPAPRLLPLDVDADPELLARYDLRVPVLAVSGGDGGWRDLPPVPPRLGGERLARWLADQGAL